MISYDRSQIGHQQASEVLENTLTKQSISILVINVTQYMNKAQSCYFQRNGWLTKSEYT